MKTGEFKQTQRQKIWFYLKDNFMGYISKILGWYFSQQYPWKSSVLSEIRIDCTQYGNLHSLN